MVGNSVGQTRVPDSLGSNPGFVRASFLVPSFLLSVLPLVGFCTYTLGRSSLYLSGLRRSLQMGKELSDES